MKTGRYLQTQNETRNKGAHPNRSHLIAILTINVSIYTRMRNLHSTVGIPQF